MNNKETIQQGKETIKKGFDEMRAKHQEFVNKQLEDAKTYLDANGVDQDGWKHYRLGKYHITEEPNKPLRWIVTFKTCTALGISGNKDKHFELKGLCWIIGDTLVINRNMGKNKGLMEEWYYEAYSIIHDSAPEWTKTTKIVIFWERRMDLLVKNGNVYKRHDVKFLEHM